MISLSRLAMLVGMKRKAGRKRTFINFLTWYLTLFQVTHYYSNLSNDQKSLLLFTSVFIVLSFFDYDWLKSSLTELILWSQVAGGLAGETPVIISAAMRGLARLAYEFSDLVSSATNLLPSTFLLLQRKNREIIKVCSFSFISAFSGHF